MKKAIVVYVALSVVIMVGLMISETSGKTRYYEEILNKVSIETGTESLGVCTKDEVYSWIKEKTGLNQDEMDISYLFDQDHTSILLVRSKKDSIFGTGAYILAWI